MTNFKHENELQFAMDDLEPPKTHVNPNISHTQSLLLRRTTTFDNLLLNLPKESAPLPLFTTHAKISTAVAEKEKPNTSSTPSPGPRVQVIGFNIPTKSPSPKVATPTRTNSNRSPYFLEQRTSHLMQASNVLDTKEPELAVGRPPVNGNNGFLMMSKLYTDKSSKSVVEVSSNNPSKAAETSNETLIGSVEDELLFLGKMSPV